MSEKRELFYPARISDAGGDPSKRWFVHYGYFNESTRKIDRIKVYQDPDLGLVHGNRLKSYNEKQLHFSRLASAINQKLSSGWCPYGRDYMMRNDITFMSASQAIENAIKFKQVSMRHTSFKSYRSHLKYLDEFLVHRCLSMLSIKEISRKHISEFLFYIQMQKQLSNRSVNNYLIDIRSAFSIMVEMEYIEHNPCVKIPKKTAPRNKHLLYDRKLLQRLRDHMADKDPNLAMFCKFIWMGMRPLEIVKLRVRDIDLENMTIKVMAKNEKTGNTKFKRIFACYDQDVRSILANEHTDSDFLFTSRGVPGPVPTTRDFFTKRFQKVKKQLGLEDNYTMYGLRHTMAVQLFKKGENIKNIMNVTGHSTLDAFQHYISEYLNEPAVDVGGKFDYMI